MLLFGIAALAAANAYTALATSLAHLLASRVLAGFAAASISPMLYALAAEHAETERRASRMAQVNSGLVIALGLGAPFGLLVGDIGNWRLVFLGLASALTLMLPLNMRAWRTAGGPPPRAAQGAAAAPESLLQAWPHLLTMTAWASSVYAGYTLLATALGREHAADAGHIAALLSSFGCGAALGVLLGGKIADRIGSWPMVQAALLAMSAIFAALAWLWSAASLPVLATGLFLLALSAYGFFPRRKPMPRNTSPPPDHGARHDEQRPLPGHHYRRAAGAQRFNTPACRRCYACPPCWPVLGRWPRAPRPAARPPKPAHSLRTCSRSAALREASHGEYELKMLMYHEYIPLFRSFSPCLAPARGSMNTSCEAPYLGRARRQAAHGLRGHGQTNHQHQPGRQIRRAPRPLAHPAEAGISLAHAPSGQQADADQRHGQAQAERRHQGRAQGKMLQMQA